MTTAQKRRVAEVSPRLDSTRLTGAQALSQREQLQAAQQGPCHGQPPHQVERDHRAVAARLGGRQGVVGVGLQSRIDDLGDQRVLFQEARDADGIALAGIHPHVKRLEATQCTVDAARRRSQDSKHTQKQKRHKSEHIV